MISPTPCDPHIFAAFQASAAGCALSSVLPSSDLAEEMRALLQGQFDIMCNYLEGKHYGTNSLNDYLLYLEEIKRQVKRIQETKREGRG